MLLELRSCFISSSWPRASPKPNSLLWWVVVVVGRMVVECECVCGLCCVDIMNSKGMIIGDVNLLGYK